MALRTSIAPLCAVFCAGLAGCVTEAGRSGPALWSSVNENEDTSVGRLRHPDKTHLRFAELSERRGQHSVARQHYEAVLKSNPRSVEAILGVARLDQYAGRTPEAARGFDKAYRLAPRDPKVLHSVGLFRAAQGRWKESKALLHAAVGGAPRSREYRKSLGLVLAKTGDYQHAWPELVKSMGEGEAHYYIGSYMLEQGDRQRAARQFQLAVLKSPGLDEARERLAQLGVPAPQQRVARALPQDNRPIRSVGHVVDPRDAGTRSAWQQDRRRQPQSRYDGGDTLQSAYDRPQRPETELRIIPRSRAGQDDGPVIQPRQTARRLPSQPDSTARPAGADRMSPQQLQQWSNQRPIR